MAFISYDAWRRMGIYKSLYNSNWMSTVGKNIDEVENLLADYVGVRHAVALSCGTAALHMAIKLAAERLLWDAPCRCWCIAGT